MAAPRRNIKKSQYYVWYLGWKECKGVAGREFTEPIVKDLLRKRRDEYLPKLTLEVSKKELKITQVVDKPQKGRPKQDKVKYPPIPAKDVTYAVQALSPDEDVVACIYLGYNPRTQCAVHVHIYRCDSVATAELLVEHLNQVISIPEHQKRVAKIEAELVSKGQILGRTVGVGDDRSETSSHSSGHQPSPRDNRNMRDPRIPPAAPQPEEEYDPYSQKTREEIEQELKEEHDREIYQCLAEEFKQKLQGGLKSPILVPPKDYETVRGQTRDYESRRWRAFDPEKVGESAPSQSVDSARGDSEGGSNRSSGLGPKDYDSAIDQNFFSQFELRRPEGQGQFQPIEPEVQRSRENGRQVKRTDSGIRDNDTNSHGSQEGSVSQPAWVKDLYQDNRDFRRKTEPRKADNQAKSKGDSADHYQGIDNPPAQRNGDNLRAYNQSREASDMHTKVPHWKKSEAYYHQEQPRPSTLPVSPIPRAVSPAPRPASPVGRPFSPMPMVPYDEWLSTPGQHDYISDTASTPSAESPQSPYPPSGPYGGFPPQQNGYPGYPGELPYPQNPRSPRGDPRGDPRGGPPRMDPRGDPYYPHPGDDPYLRPPGVDPFMNSQPPPQRGKKYTASSLGLTEPEPRSPRQGIPPGRYPDEGYRSLDPGDYRGRYPMDDPRDYPGPAYPPGMNYNSMPMAEAKERKKKKKDKSKQSKEDMRGYRY